MELIDTTNFDTVRLSEIVASGLSVVTNQLQYSVLDHRPENGLVAFCVAQGIRLLCYGTLAGGFIAERWLGAPEPRPPFANRSLVKYRLILEDFGGWPRFQELLSVLDAIAKRRRVSVASVAIRYVLDKPGVAVAIVGARDSAHLDDLVQAVTLDEEDRDAIARVVSRATGPRGDCYELERVEGGPHNMIMWKNQNTGGAPADAPYADAPPGAERKSQ